MSKVCRVAIGSAHLFLGTHEYWWPFLDLESNGIGAVVTDPPYGMARDNSGHKVVARLGAVIGDDQPFDPSLALSWGLPTILWGANHYASRLPDASRWLVWVKHDWSLLDKRSTSNAELAWTNLGGSLRVKRHIWDGSIKEGVGAGRPHVHPTEKPVELMEWCLSFLPEGVGVLDPYMGSGTTGVAAAMSNRRFMGIEVDGKHFDTACRRIEDAQRQGRLIA